MANILFFDLETTDVDPKRGGGIHQIAYILEVDGEVICEREFKCAPFKNDLVNAQSLSVCGVDYQTVLCYPSPIEAFKAIINDLHPFRKVVLSGFNIATFDMPFFLSWWFKCRNELKRFDLNLVDYIYFDPLDVRVLAINSLIEERASMQTFKLSDVAEKLGIEVEKGELHDALYDVKLARGIYHKLKVH
jgi:DNA polymerase III epsilon subunit-like protein